jgi:uncharacterized membrane protein (UPF0127 family)
VKQQKKRSDNFYKVYKGKRIICRTRIVEGMGAQIGLMFHRKLNSRETLTLKLPKVKVDIHTFFVFFPLDIFFLDSCMKVIEKATMEPWKIYLPKNIACFALEANKGEFNLKVGDKLIIKKS